LVDTLGLILNVVVHAADIQDRDGAKLVLKRMKQYFYKLTVIWADGAYAGQLISWAQRYYGWTIAIVKRSDSTTGFRLLPKRWIVERTFAWFGNYRRLAKDYEYAPATSETMIYIAMIHLMVRRLA
jgi:putative transposase